MEFVPDINVKYYGVEFCAKMSSDHEGKRGQCKNLLKGLYSLCLRLWGHIMGITYSDEQPNTKEAFN